jgi:hypothetical protein
MYKSLLSSMEQMKHERIKIPYPVLNRPMPDGMGSHSNDGHIKARLQFNKRRIKAMNASELKYNVETKTTSNFFSRSSMKFFGDTMRNYGVCSAEVKTWDGEKVKVWELYRKHPVKHGLDSSAYFNKSTFERVHPKR